MSEDEIFSMMKDMGFGYAVKLVKDVSVLQVGSIVSYHRSGYDASWMCSKLCSSYNRPNSHMVVVL